MKKIHCDVCDAVLTTRKNTLLGTESHTHWEIIEHKYFLCIATMGFINPLTKKSLTVCGECIADFKEFVLRKQKLKKETVWKK